MKTKYYIIELGDAKEKSEMNALELSSADQALGWIQESMESDSEYFGIYIDCDINTIKYKQYDKNNFYCQALVCVKYESIVTNEMIDSEIYSPEDLITSNLSIVSKIITKLEEQV